MTRLALILLDECLTHVWVTRVPLSARVTLRIMEHLEHEDHLSRSRGR